MEDIRCSQRHGGIFIQKINLTKRVVDISTQIVRYKSISMAEKALEVLKNNGYRGYIRRTAPMAGGSCGFAVYVENSNGGSVKELLSKNGL